MKVRTVMHKGATSVQLDTPVREIARRMRKYDIGAVPVRANGAVVGMITDRDIACRALGRTGNVARLTAKDVMTPKVVTCSPDEDIASAIRKMERKKVRRLPVVNGNGAVVGMLSLGDIAQKVAKQLSGEILRAVSAHHR
ncbi:MAG TPA: CBS domain-containing protein [Xanthobacteraceae bacterium]|nr:CBS domain-containing protein [Xanthobacteraceae bacterium]